MIRSTSTTRWLLPILLSGVCLRAGAAPFTFTKFLDTNTLIPGAAETFTGFNRLAFSNGNVAFRGFGGSPVELRGVYSVIDGALGTVADKTTPVPLSTGGASGTFTDFDFLDIDGGTVAFEGRSAAGAFVYSSDGTALAAVADGSTPVPGGTGTLTSASISSIDNGIIGIKATGGSPARLVYTIDGTSTTVHAGAGDPMPGTALNFFDLGLLDVDGPLVAFPGRSLDGSLAGLYTNQGGPLRRVIDQNTPIPGGSGTFVSFGGGGGGLAAVVDQGLIAFRGGNGVDPSGIYIDDGGVLSVVADSNTVLPGGSGNFTFVGTPAVSSGAVAFVGIGGPGEGALLSTLGGSLAPIISFGETLDGKVVTSLGLANRGLDGNALAFQAGFNDGSVGIFMAAIAVPEPSPLWMMLIGIGGIVSAGRRKRVGSRVRSCLASPHPRSRLRLMPVGEPTIRKS